MKKKRDKIGYRAVRIDKFALDTELLEQPQLFMEWANKAAEATTEKERIRDKLELLRAEVDLEVRKNPDEYDIPDGKATEGAIKLAVTKDARVLRLTRLYRNACHDERILKNAQIAFNHRKKMLEKLVDLNLQLHFIEPRIDVEHKEIMTRRTKKDILKDLKRGK
ncbi:hypothetical protein AYK24_06575 [Thermoplasmatales archaeon SG8-52-4]|nr:MAG: hypothetical protein AYK24_06575 [Thermoplasmatales archaeon SG8-52-4]